MYRSSCYGNSKKDNPTFCKPASITKEKNVPIPPISVTGPPVTNVDSARHNQPTMNIDNDFTNVTLQ